MVHAPVVPMKIVERNVSPQELNVDALIAQSLLELDGLERGIDSESLNDALRVTLSILLEDEDLLRCGHVNVVCRSLAAIICKINKGGIVHRSV